MKLGAMILCVLVMSLPAAAQNSADSTDLLGGLWHMDDANPIPVGSVDLRLGFSWVTEQFPANLGDSDDDFAITPRIVWGALDNVEMTIAVPVWLGDGGDVGALTEGNADTTLSVLWRFKEQEGADGTSPAMALSASARIPTGDNSSGVDGELRLHVTNAYSNGLRSHVNGFVKSVNGDNDSVSHSFRRARFNGFRRSFRGNNDLDSRDFQWGVVIGMDGPLCDDGAVRWVTDYMHSSGEHDGLGDMDVLEVGSEWTISNEHKLGFSVQAGLDHTGDNPNFGAGVMYSYSIQ